MRRWSSLLLVMFLAVAYWGYSVDLECHIHGYLECLTQHADEPTGCAAPSIEAPAPAGVACLPSVTLVLPQPQLVFVRPPLPCDEQSPLPPPDPHAEPGPPRAPPSAILS